MMEEQRAIWDRKRALENLGGDEELLDDVIRLFIERKDILLLALEEALEKRDGEAASNAAHAFKGAVNHFAAKRCRNLAQSIEDLADRNMLHGLEDRLVELRHAAATLEKELKLQL